MGRGHRKAGHKMPPASHWNARKAGRIVWAVTTARLSTKCRLRHTGMPERLEGEYGPRPPQGFAASAARVTEKASRAGGESVGCGHRKRSAQSAACVTLELARKAGRRVWAVATANGCVISAALHHTTWMHSGGAESVGRPILPEPHIGNKNVCDDDAPRRPAAPSWPQG